MFKLFAKDPDKLLKEATSKKKSGDLETAISLLKKAYKAILKSDAVYGIDPFLRLPLYLQEANRSDEAWKEFEYLLNSGYPNQPHNPQLIPMDHAIIYDKMRLFLQREEKNIEAVKYGIFSHLSWAIGLFLQKRSDEFKDYVTAETIEDTTKKLLKKAAKIELSDDISNIIKREIKNIPNIDFEILGNKVNAIFQ